MTSDFRFSRDSECGRLARELDWSQTPMGDVATWPRSLVHYVDMLMDLPTGCILFWGEEDLVQIYNDGYSQIMGPRHPRYFAAPYRDCWPDTYPHIIPLMRRVLAGEAIAVEKALFAVTRHGFWEEAYFTFTFSPLRDDRGVIRGILQPIVEVTETVIADRRAETLRALAPRLDSDDPLKEAVDALSASPKDVPFAQVFLWDAERGDVEASAATASLLASGVDLVPIAELARRAATTSTPIDVPDGLSAEAGAKLSPWEAPVRRLFVQPLRRARADRPRGAVVFGVSPAVRFDEKYRGFFEVVAGQIAAALDGKNALRDARERADALAALDRAKTTFFSNVSHELRTPLTLILGPVEEASRSASLSTDERAALVAAHRNALRLLKLVNAMLDFSRIEAGRATPLRVPVDLGELTRDLASAFQTPMDRAGLRFLVTVGDLGGPVAVDRDMWEKIVLNLLSNAFKFTLEGEIEIALSRTDTGVRLVVRDTGVGIPAGELPRLFERFHRVEGARGRSFEGTGIGLSLVQQLVKLHGGTISVTSEVDRGTTFVVDVPDAEAERDVLPAGRPSDPHRGAAFALEAMRWLPGTDEVHAGDGLARVLVADDNADMRDYLVRLLGERWRVRAVPNGKRALDLLEEEGADLVVSDVMMPELDGFALLSALRASPSTREIPVLLLSARAGEGSRGAAIEAGADDYLVKPFVARELLARVQSLLDAQAARKRTEESRRMLATLVEQAPVAIALWRGPEHRFALANDRYLEMVGRSRDVIGRRIADVFPEDTVASSGLFGTFDRVYETGEPFAVAEYPLSFDKESDGTRQHRTFAFSLSPLREHGVVEGLVAVAVDVTEQIAAREKIDALRETAEAASRAKDEFLHVLSHELRTPLNAILGWTTMLAQGVVAQAQIPHAIATIERNARAQVRLVEDLLDVSRIEQGKMVLSVGPVEMVRVVRAALEAVQPAADARGVRLQPVLDSHATIVGDADRLQQVVWNLLSNAIKFTPRGGRVLVTLHRMPSYVELRVADTGQGIEPSFLPHVFERFRQADPSSTRVHGGLGLGLAIVRSLVDLHGGTVTAESEGRGKGATFAVRLPSAPVRAEPASATGAPRDPGAPRTFECPPELAGKTVLVVDDEHDTRELLTFVISQCDCRVTTAGSGPEALELLQKSAFDVVVSDVGMPGMDGHELIQKIRADAGRLRAVPAIALTAYAGSEDRTRAMRSGFDMHLPKPIEPAELLATMAALVSARSRW